MYYAIIRDNKIIDTGLYPHTDEDVLNVEISGEEYTNIVADMNKYIYSEGSIIINPQLEEEQATLRREQFNKSFLITSLGNYRLVPQGYANAQQAIDVVNNNVNMLGSLTEELTQWIIFYETPDFTKEEECTEEWLVAHQKNPEPMTLEEWQKFYFEFCQLYAQSQYKK